MQKLLVFADVHHGNIMPDAISRLQTIFKAAKEQNVDAVICLGDVAWTIPENKQIADLWNGLPMPHYMVLGNHDMDKSSKSDAVAFYQMPANYYTFDVGAYRFFALDTNYYREDGIDHDYSNSNYYGKVREIIPKEQLDWLKKALSQTDKRCVLLSHARLFTHYDDAGCTNYREILDCIDAHNASVGYPQIFLCINGHNHTDSLLQINDVHYLDLNSASNQWIDAATPLEPNEVFGEQDHQNNPYLKFTIPYRDPLYAILTLDEERKQVSVKGRKSEFVGPSLKERNHPEYFYDTKITPVISDHAFEYK